MKRHPWHHPDMRQWHPPTQANRRRRAPGRAAAARGAISALLSAVAIACTLLAIGCQSHPPPVDNVNLHLTPSHRSIMAGELVTVEARIDGAGGHDTDIQWQTTGGEVTEIKERVAQVQFDQPGDYRIHGQLYVDGKLVRSSHVDVEVRPVQ